jgi:sarcosine oxidase
MTTAAAPGDSVYDVIVVGVGAMGAATCYHLARRGLRALGLEQFGIPHALGSSHGYSRAIRLAYYEHHDYVPLLRRAWDGWRALEAAAGQTLLHASGGLYLGAPGSELVAGSLQAAREHGLAHEALTRADIAARFPQFGGVPTTLSGFGSRRPACCCPNAPSPPSRNRRCARAPTCAVTSP